MYLKKSFKMLWKEENNHNKLDKHQKMKELHKLNVELIK